MNGTQIADVIVHHHLIWGTDAEASCLCGWSDLSALFGYHLLGVFMDICDAEEEGVAPVLPIMGPYKASTPRPRDDDQAIFAAIRGSRTYGEASLLLEWESGGLYTHLDVLEGRGELPDDIVAWRRSRSFAARSRDERKAEAPAPEPVAETLPDLPDAATVADVYDFDKTIAGTARRLGISVSTVKRRLKEAGIEPPIPEVRELVGDTERRIPRFT